ncbi:MAG: CsbD family protein [Acidimicrobiales bacterium]
MGDKIGKITETAGRVTGDRAVEAKGRVEQDLTDPDESVGEVSEEAIETEEQVVRAEHGDIDPNASEDNEA